MFSFMQAISKSFGARNRSRIDKYILNEFNFISLPIKSHELNSDCEIRLEASAATTSMPTQHGHPPRMLLYHRRNVWFVLRAFCLPLKYFCKHFRLLKKSTCASDSFVQIFCFWFIFCFIAKLLDRIFNHRFWRDWNSKRKSLSMACDWKFPRSKMCTFKVISFLISKFSGEACEHSTSSTFQTELCAFHQQNDCTMQL